MSRPGTPNHLRIAGGDYSKALPDTEEGKPKKPKHIADDKVAAAKWKELVSALAKQGKLTQYDGDCIAAAAEVYAELVKAKAAMAVTGTVGEDSHGNATVHPNFRIWKELLTQWKDALRQFGLTPATRNRVATVATKKKNAFDMYKQAANAEAG